MRSDFFRVEVAKDGYLAAYPLRVDEIGDIQYCEMPELFHKYADGETIMTIETAKSVYELPAPCRCFVTWVNGEWQDNTSEAAFHFREVQE